MRLIDADALLHTLGVADDCGDCPYNAGVFCGNKAGFEPACEAISDAPTIDPELHWVPVTERLPENACQCIVTAKVKHVDNYPDYEVDTADFADGIFTTTNAWWGVESITAWMPLPKPYKGGKGDGCI